MDEICEEYHLGDLTSRVLYPISVGILARAQNISTNLSLRGEKKLCVFSFMFYIYD